MAPVLGGISYLKNRVLFHAWALTAENGAAVPYSQRPARSASSLPVARSQRLRRPSSEPARALSCTTRSRYPLASIGARKTAGLRVKTLLGATTVQFLLWARRRGRASLRGGAHPRLHAKTRTVRAARSLSAKSAAYGEYREGIMVETPEGGEADVQEYGK